MVKWDKMEKIYGLLMYSTEGLAVLTIFLYLLKNDVRLGIMAIIFTVLTATCHILLLIYHRTRKILEKL